VVETAPAFLYRIAGVVSTAIHHAAGKQFCGIGHVLVNVILRQPGSTQP